MKNGSAAAGSVTYRSDMRPPRVPRPRDRRPILIATKAMLLMGQDTSMAEAVRGGPGRPCSRVGRG